MRIHGENMSDAMRPTTCPGLAFAAVAAGRA